MGRIHALSPARRCDYSASLRNLWDLPLERLAIYIHPFQHPGGYYKVSKQAICQGNDWIGIERYLEIIEETIPFRILSKKEKGLLMLQYLRENLRASSISIDDHACVLIDYLNCRPNYFHWFLDALPRILAAESYLQDTGNAFSVVIPEFLQPWQADSLQFLGISSEQLIRVRPDSNEKTWCFERLITSFSHRHIRHSNTGHFDALCPDSILSLSGRLQGGTARILRAESCKRPFSRRLFISRGDVLRRRVSNEDAVMATLAPHGFQRLSLDGMPLALQIQCFLQATHIIAAHGGALTNLMHIPAGCQVLEIFQRGHGVRPDFFQLAALRGGIYSFAYADSINDRDDIEIPIKVLRRFLEASL